MPLYPPTNSTPIAPLTVASVLAGLSRDPDTLPGRLAQYSADAITGYNDGDPLTAWDDPVSGFNLTGSGSARPTYKANLQNGLPGVVFYPASTPSQMLTSGVFNSGNLSQCTVITVRKMNQFSDGGFNVLFSFAGNAFTNPFGAGTGAFVAYQIYAGTQYYTNNNTTSVALSQANYVDPGAVGLEVFRYDGTNRDIRCNGVQAKNEAAVSSLGISGALSVGSLINGGTPALATFFEVIIFNRALTDVEVSLVENFLFAKYSLANQPRFIFDGDSIMAGYQCALSSQFPSQLVAAIGTSARFTGINMAIDGQTIQAMANGGGAVSALSSPARLQYLAPKTSGLEIYVCWAGVNDMDHGARTPTQVINDTKTLSAAIRGQGRKFVLCTPLPTTISGVDAEYEANRQTLIAYHRLHWPEYADGFIDLGSEPTMGNAATPDNATYYVDKLHPTSLGDGLLAVFARPTFSAMLGAGGLAAVITPAGTNGAQTISSLSGSVNFAIGSASVVVTNPLCIASSVVQVTVASNDSTMTSAQAVASAGYFTIYPNAVPTAACRVNFTVQT